MIFMVCFLMVLPKINAQEDNCLSKLKKAQELFDSGLIEEIPFLLDSCMKDGFNNEQLIQSYRLLIQVYLFDYDQGKAENTMLDLLSKFPEYEIHSNDPVEFVNLYNQFQTRPKYSFSISPGVNFTNISVLEQYSTGNLNNLDSEYKPAINADLKLSFEKYFGTKMWITFGLSYSYAGYEVNERMNFDRELLSFTEKMQFANAPLYFNFALSNSKKITPFVFVGGQFGYLLKSTGEINRRSLVESSTDLKGIAKDITESRNRENYSALAGIGLRYKIASGYLRANLYYTRGLNNYVKESSRFGDNENLFYFNYIDDKIRVNLFHFNIGYSYIFYRTTKKLQSDVNN